ncbi:MAG: transcription antitermination factor NusB [Xanthomonadales bacterium]|jgi:N utilization substance protein B|nr:transcription antitermination factor NusB [Xanthomonadales bacterium]
MSRPRGDSPHAARARARRRVLQALYQWQITAQPMRGIVAQFELAQDLSIIDRDYFLAALTGIEEGREALDALIKPCLDRPIEQVDAIERAVLRLGVWELKERLDVPYRVVLNEAIDLAHEFGAEGGHSYVNGVLARLGPSLRPQEAASGGD